MYSSFLSNLLLSQLTFDFCVRDVRKNEARKKPRLSRLRFFIEGIKNRFKSQPLIEKQIARFSPILASSTT